MNKTNFAVAVIPGEEAQMVEVMVARYKLLPIAHAASSMTGSASPSSFPVVAQSVAAEPHTPIAHSNLATQDHVEYIGHPDQLPPVKRTAIEYNALRQLAAINNYRAVKELKVSQKVSVAINHETVVCVCSATGMTVELIVPKIPGMALVYTNPLSIYKNVVGMIEKGTEYLSKLDSQVLAGMFLTAYRHYDLVARQGTTGPTSLALNAMLRTAGKQILVDALDLIKHITSGNKDRLPMFSLDYNAHKEFASVGPALQEYNKAIRNVIYPGAEAAWKKSSEAVELAGIEAEKYQDDSSFVLKESKATKTKLSSAERDYEEKFVANRREAKLILARLLEARTVPTMFILKLKPVFVGKNLVAMAETTRAIVAAKLRTYASADAARLAVIVEEGHNPYDIFADIDDAFDTNETNLKGLTATPQRKLSLAEILAQKKAGTFVAPSEAVEPVIQEEVEVKLSYTEEDALRHLEIEEALDAGNIVSEEDAEWNAKYLRAIEDQEYPVPDRTEGYDDSKVDTSGEDF